MRVLARLGLALACLAPVPPAQGQPALPPAQRCRVVGRVTSGKLPLPGVALTASVPGGGEAAASSTSVEGIYALVLPAPGTFVVRANLAGFAEATEGVTLAAGDCSGTVDFELALLSRVPASEPAPARPPEVPSPGERGRVAGAPRARFRDLSVRSNNPGGNAPDNGAEAPDAALQALLPQGFSADAPTDSVAMTGSQVQTVDSLLFRDRMFLLDEVGGDLEALRRRIAEGGLEGMTTGGAGGPGFRAPGGFGPPPGGPGGFGPGPGGGGFREGFGGRGESRLQGSVFYNLAGAPFDASPYPLNGRSEKADYFQHRYGASVGGPVKIPGFYDGQRTSFFLT